MGKKKCPACEFEFSAYLIQPLVTNKGTLNMCPICALKARNKSAGFPVDTPFTGTVAAQLHKEALLELEEQKK